MSSTVVLVVGVSNDTCMQILLKRKYQAFASPTKEAAEGVLSDAADKDNNVVRA